MIFKPLLVVLPVSILLAIKIPLASVMTGLKLIVEATIATDPAGVKVVSGATRVTVTVPVEIKTILYGRLKGVELELIERSPPPL